MPQTEYLVNHGRTAFLGRFRNRADREFTHGDRVIVRSARGLEAGSVLGEASPRFAHLLGAGEPGDLLHAMTSADDGQQAEFDLLAHRLLAETQATAEELNLSVAILDLEILLDGTSAIVHTIPDEQSDLTSLAQTLSSRHGLIFTILDLRQPATPEPHGCGKPDCGSGGAGGCSSCGTGGGCSTGSCSSGSVKNADELTGYFAGLRRQMEEQTARVPLHG